MQTLSWKTPLLIALILALLALALVINTISLLPYDQNQKITGVITHIDFNHVSDSNYRSSADGRYLVRLDNAMEFEGFRSKTMGRKIRDLHIGDQVTVWYQPSYRILGFFGADYHQVNQITRDHTTVINYNDMVDYYDSRSKGGHFFFYWCTAFAAICLLLAAWMKIKDITLTLDESHHD